MKCTKCDHKNRAKAKFCDSCGAPLGSKGSLPTKIVTGDGGVAVGGKVTGGIRINSPSTIVHGEKAASPRALMSAYLEAVVRECAPLRLKAIDQRAAGPGREPLGLTSVYVDLDLDWQIPEKYLLKTFLNKSQSTSAVSVRGHAAAETEKNRNVPVLEALAAFPRFVLLGAPGSGKSTIGAYVALTLAEARLGKKTVLRRLGPWWKLGVPIPVRVVLRQFAAALPPGVERGRAKHLWDFIKAELANCGLTGPVGETLERHASKDGALFLLDGLDETKDVATRIRVGEAVTEFMAQASSRSRFFLTSRPYAWEEMIQTVNDAAMQPAEREACTSLLSALPVRQQLADLQPAQTQRFIDGWYQAISTLGWISEDDARVKAPELKDAVCRDDLRSLAANPLLLTLMATLHSNRARLPDDRADLYNEVVELLLQRWNETVGADRGLLDALAIPSLKLSDLRGALEQLAFEIHGAHAGQEGVADIPEGDLVSALKPLVAGSADKAALVVDYVEKRAGLLLGHGLRGRQRQFSFPHRTFQEFLAGCYLSGVRTYEDEVVKLAGENPRHWREVLKFAARRATAGRGVPASAVLVNHADANQWLGCNNPSDSDWRKAMLAAEQLLEIGLAAVNSRAEHREVRERVTGWLVRLLELGALPAAERARAGNLLARLGDPRKGIAPTNLDELRAMEFCYVPSGDFWRGDLRSDSQMELRKLDYGFWIARHPVTVAQFNLFVQAGGYRDGELWVEAKAGKIWHNGRLRVEKPTIRTETIWRDQPFEPLGLANHPVTSISWYEATAYCRWLSLHWSDLLGSVWHVALAGGYEWAKAARGAESVPEHVMSVRASDGFALPADMKLKRNAGAKRIFPWGDELDAEKANYIKAGIFGTSAAGCFPAGISPYGVFDLAGNVWEFVGQNPDPCFVRGGSYVNEAQHLVCDSSHLIDAERFAPAVGFRIVVSPRSNH